jgi:uncharacterized protein (DUF58 family)
MRTRLNLWLAVAALAPFLGGVALGEWRLLVLPLPLLVLLALSTFYAPPHPEVEVRRVLEAARIMEGQRVKVTLHIRNGGKSIEVLEVLESLPSDLSVVSGSNHLILHLGEGEEVVVEFEVHAPLSGQYSVGPTLVRALDPLGLFFTEMIVGAPDRLTVTPRMEDLRRLELVPRRTRPWLGQILSRRRGVGTEFWGLRDYDPSDDVRHINWKVTARTDGLISNEFEGELSGDVVIVLDAREQSSLGSPPDSTTQYGVRAAVSIAAKALASRNRAGIIIQRDVLDWVYPAYGRQQLYRIIHRLMVVRPGGTWPLEHVAGVLTRFFPPQCQVVLITPLLDRKAVDGVAGLASRGFEVVIVSPSPVAIMGRQLEGDGAAALALRILAAERDTIMAELRDVATVVDWNPGQPLATGLRALRGVRPSGRR